MTVIFLSAGLFFLLAGCSALWRGVVTAKDAIKTQGHKLWLVALLPVFSVVEFKLGKTYQAHPPLHFGHPAWVPIVIFSCLLGNIAASALLITCLKGARNLVAGLCLIATLLNLGVTETSFFALAGTGF